MSSVGGVPFYDDGTVRILHGDCRELLGDLRADVIVTDPPYDLAFMGRAWDKLPAGFHEAWARAALRALPPGGWLLAFGGTRTWHRLACGIEDAGFEIRDTFMWLQGQGFPKGKACLKPLWEPVLLARKPGSSVLQIDACRVGGPADTRRPKGNSARPFPHHDDNWVPHLTEGGQVGAGRWPPNVLLTHSESCQPVGVRKVRVAWGQPRGGGSSENPTFNHWNGGTEGRPVGFADPDGTETVEAWECDPECPVFLLDQQSGERPPPWGGPTTYSDSGGYGGQLGRGVQGPLYYDKGGASRFYYTAKAGRNERVTIDGKQHETVKPLKLMRWLVRLVTPPGGTVLDPFCGSGSTLVAAAMEGFRAVGIEADERWCRGSAQRVMELPPIQETLAL